MGGLSFGWRDLFGRRGRGSLIGYGNFGSHPMNCVIDSAARVAIGLEDSINMGEFIGEGCS